MTIAELTAEIREVEARIAYGSETELWGMYLDNIKQETGVSPIDQDTVEPLDGDPPVVADGIAQWWLRAYDLRERIEDLDEEQVSRLHDERGSDLWDGDSGLDATEAMLDALEAEAVEV